MVDWMEDQRKQRDRAVDSAIEAYTGQKPLPFVEPEMGSYASSVVQLFDRIGRLIATVEMTVPNASIIIRGDKFYMLDNGRFVESQMSYALEIKHDPWK